MNTPRTSLLGTIFTLLSLLPGMAFALPEIQHWRTDNGARVYFVAAREIPIVDMRIVFDAGSARDDGNAGLSQLTNALLRSGTADLSADAVAERLEGVGARLSTGVQRDMAWLDLRSLSDPQYLTQVVDTIARLLREPLFDPVALARERNRMIAAARERAQSPAAIGERAFYRALYGDHPYASPPGGDEASVNAIQRKAVQAFHRRYYAASNGVVAIVGDLDRATAEALADQLVGGLPAGEPAQALPEVQPVAEAEIIRIAHPSSQSHVYMGQIGMRRGDSDYFSLYLGNHVLGGGGLVSRLFDEVREKRGLSYSVRSRFSLTRELGPFFVGLQTRNDQVDEAVDVVMSTLNDFVARGPDPNELEAARQNIIGGFALRIDSNRKIVQYLAMIGFYAMPLDYLQTFKSNIDNISLQQVSDAFQRRVLPDRFITIIVGG